MLDLWSNIGLALLDEMVVGLRSLAEPLV